MASLSHVAAQGHVCVAKPPARPSLQFHHSPFVTRCTLTKPRALKHRSPLVQEAAEASLLTTALFQRAKKQAQPRRPTPSRSAPPPETSIRCSAAQERNSAQAAQARSPVPCSASVSDRSGDFHVCQAAMRVVLPTDGVGTNLDALRDFPESHPALVTGFFFFLWYFLNVVFNILNKKIYNYFPYPYFVSAIHLLVGVLYCSVCWALGFPKRAPVDKELLLALAPVAFCHALGHVMTNVSFASVAVSFTHTVKALEPFFSAAASQFVLGQAVPLHLWASLMPVVIGVCMASVTELSFNWTGFITAMISNVSFTYRNIFSKKAMVGMDSTNLYAYISILSLIYCVPLAVVLEGPKLMAVGFKGAIASVGLNKFLVDLFWVGMFYHLYNQLASNTLERVSPLTHAVGNVLKRVFVIGFSIVIFGNKISTQTAIGTGIAIAGVGLYSMLKAKEPKKAKA